MKSSNGKGEESYSVDNVPDDSKAPLPGKLNRLDIFQGLHMFRSIIGKAPASRLASQPNAYWNLLAVADRFSTKATKDKGAF